MLAAVTAIASRTATKTSAWPAKGTILSAGAQTPPAMGASNPAILRRPGFAIYTPKLTWSIRRTYGESAQNGAHRDHHHIAAARLVASADRPRTGRRSGDGDPASARGRRAVKCHNCAPRLGAG